MKRLTANHDTHQSVSDLSRSVCKLPSLPKPKEAAQATGTDGKPATAPENCSAYAPRLVPNNAALCRNLAIPARWRIPPRKSKNPRNPLKQGLRGPNARDRT